MGEKKSIDIKMFWYTNILVIPKFVTIVTTLDKEGMINAAPYSLGTPFDVGKSHPQIILGMRKSSHSCQNAVETGEFVVNFPSSKHLQDVMETAQFMPKGENELDHTRFTTIPSKKVKPPSIKECPQHLECRFNDIIDLGFAQSFVIGDVVDIVVDEELISMNRHDRIRAVDPPVYLGDERRRNFYFGKIGEIELVKFHLPEKRDRRKKVRTKLPWENNALKELLKVPVFVREFVIEQVENIVKQSGFDNVTFEQYKKIEEEYMPQDIDNKHR